ncbi:MAG TPA: methyltransferase [Lysobacter sp.]
MQEQWLATFLRERARAAGRPLRVLDVGCGFGRLAPMLVDVPGLHYHGYDISESMTAVLLADATDALASDGKRIRVADNPSEAFAGQTFDVVFTVSVMMHNAPADARRLFDDMSTLLAEGGTIVLVENELAALPLRASEHHGGIWLHDIVGDIAAEWDIDLYPDALKDRGIYVLARARKASRRLILHTQGQVAREVSGDEVKLAGLAALSRAIETMADISGDGAIQELQQLREDASFRRQLRSVLREARAELAPPGNAIASPTHAHPARAHDASPFIFDAPTDLRFANPDVRFGPLAQVFHKEWFGIRAACGSLPGTKLAITANAPLSAADLEEIIETCRSRRIDRMLLHGMSDSMYAFAKAMHRANISPYIVWHGAAAMWVHEAERKYFELSASLLANGVVRRLHPIRRGTDIVLGHANAYGKQLLNAVPNVRIDRVAPRQSESAIAFSPSWNLLHKNLATNLAAANVAPRVGTIWAMASDAVLVGDRHKKFERLPPQNQLEIMQTMALADVVLNVSIVDCHPMVDMEALAAGTPCVRGRLFLDALEDHPYVRLTEVENMLSVEDVARVIDRVLATPQAEMDAYMRDYGAAMTRVALDRYAEFAELA